MSSPLFRAKYLVVIFEGRECPVLLPLAAVPVALPVGTAVAAGECVLHELGAPIGFTVSGWKHAGLRCRGLPDAQLLDRYFLEETIEAGQPFTTRPGVNG